MPGKAWLARNVHAFRQSFLACLSGGVTATKDLEVRIKWTNKAEGLDDVDVFLGGPYMSIRSRTHLKEPEKHSAVMRKNTLLQ